MAVTLTDLDLELIKAPIMGQFHPLVPLCLAQEVEIIPEAENLVVELDSLVPHVERPILIPKVEAKWAHRFKIVNYPACPPAAAINQSLPRRIEMVRRHLISNHQIAQQIVTDAREKKYETVVLLLVDGLSYADVIDWPEQPIPCFIDGPSITFSRTSDRKIDPRVGFPSIVGTPTLARRLIDIGIPRSRGFSYWDRGVNDVTEKLFEGMPLDKVGGFAEAFDEIEKLDCQGLFVQIIREGLDGLAHHRREVGARELEATITAIHHDYRALVDLLNEKKVQSAVYLVADHGILWKNQHDLQRVESDDTGHPRYATSNPNQPELTTEFFTDLQDFHLWHYPYVGRSVRANDSGVHGGLSYWESIVPFVKFEVNI